MSENLTITFCGIDWPFNGRIQSLKITAKADFIFAGLGDWEHLMYPSAWGITRCQHPSMDSITDISLHGFSQVKGDVVGAAVVGSIFIQTGGARILSLGSNFSLKTFGYFSNSLSFRREQVLGGCGILYFH